MAKAIAKEKEVLTLGGKESAKSNGSYEAADIQTLKDLEAVRKRPGMYIGGTGQEGYMHLIWELVDNAIDEAAGGFCNKMSVTFHKDGSIEVGDCGRGIPVELYPGKKKITALEVVFTELHAGGKFKAGAYGATGGLHGVGASVVNALSTALIAEVDRSGKTWRLGFKDGVAGKFLNNDNRKKFTAGHELEKVKSVSSGKTGTRIRFWPNIELFDESVNIDYNEVCSRVKRACCLVPGLKAEVIDKRTSGVPPFTFVSRAGLPDLLKENLGDKTPLTKPILISGIDKFTETVQIDGKPTKTERECEVEIALLWTNSYESNIQSFVNTVPTPNGGTHMLGFDKALIFSINKIVLANVKKLASLAKKNTGNLAKKEDIYEGLLAAIKVVVPEPQFKGQTKQELGTPEVQSIVYKIANKRLTNWFQNEGPKSHVNTIKDKIVNAVITREAARLTRDNKRKATNKFSSSAMPNKLADCRSHGPDSELILVEGDSAAGPAKAGRDSEFMAILPLRGKIVNASKASQKQVLDNTEAQSIFMSLGAGVGNEEFDIEKARYGRVIILCDADVDGSHIRCLLITLFYYYLRPLLEEGCIYAAQPPLYTTKVGNETHRAFTEEEREALTKKLATNNRKAENIRWQRFKGLGEMNVDELAHCALDPATRILKQITLEDVKIAKNMIETLMGRETSRRQKYLAKHGALANPELLDI